MLERTTAQADTGRHRGSRITHLEPFGAFCDIGCGVIALLPIDAISVSRIKHPRERFTPDMEILAVIRNMEDGRITLSHKELLGTWEENAAKFQPGETVRGIIRSVETYGVFVELAPNLAGLAELKEGAKPGHLASVFIKNIIPDRMKIKLIIIDVFDEIPQPQPPPIFTRSPISMYFPIPRRLYQRNGHPFFIMETPPPKRKAVLIIQRMKLVRTRCSRSGS